MLDSEVAVGVALGDGTIGLQSCVREEMRAFGCVGEVGGQVGESEGGRDGH